MQRHRSVCGLLAASTLALVAGCATAPPQLYTWGDFPRHQYDTLLKEGASPGEQIQAMETMANKATATRAALPPGFRAHLGMLYLNAGDADRARQSWEAEKKAFPESGPYIDALLARLNATPGTSTDAQKKGAPA